MLTGKRVVLGVTGGIAAYKAVEISRRLVDAGAHVVPVMTDDATRFLGATTLSALASEPVRTRLWDDPDTAIPHTTIGQDADLIIVAPATARFVAAARIGYSDDLLSNIVLAARCPVMLCPAMHTEMWEYPGVQDNVAALRSWGIHIVDPESGRLAGGDHGVGRLADPERIVEAAIGVLTTAEGVHTPSPLKGCRVVISAGGTREPIDAVRVIANRSSGKQGFALASVAVRRGAAVTLVTTVDPPAELAGSVEVARVETCDEMMSAMIEAASGAEVVVMAAAVADFRPVVATDRKMKKGDGVPELVLEPTPDILMQLGRSKPATQILVGFAAETDDLIANARSKLERKALDMIVANDVSVEGRGFESDTNAVTIITADGEPCEVKLTSKVGVAEAVFDQIETIKQSRHDLREEGNHGTLDV